MIITGGSFGNKGKLSITRRKSILIKAAKSTEYTADQIASFDASTEKNKQFGILSFLVGAIIFTVLGLLILSILGAIIGLVIAVFGSFYTSVIESAQLVFSDGKQLTLTGSSREISKLAKLCP